MFSKLKQFNDVRKQANQLKSQLAEEVVTVEHGSVKLTIDGNQDVKKVEIDSAQLSPDKRKILENDFQEATNKALKKVQRVMAEKMRKMGGFNMPGMGGGDSN